jgi:capsular polysaccharide biosynthesis protein
LEEEIDLRPYIEALVKNWMWIIGAAVIAGVVALAVSSFLPPSYEATARAAVTASSAVVEFDPRIRSVDDGQPLKAYPEIALSDDLMAALLAEIVETTPDITSIEDLRKILDASAGADDSLLRLTVTYHDPEQTAEIANRWAELFVTRVNEIYGSTGGDQLFFF